MERVQKILSAAGIASRRKSEDLIRQGRVRVNRKVVTIGMSAEAGKDEITVDGRKVTAERKRYIALYKPQWYVTTTNDPYAKKKVVDLVRSRERIYPVGRLDSDAEGLLLLSNDGEFANRVMHPRYNVEKTYIVQLQRKMDEKVLQHLRKGVKLDDGTTWPAKARFLNPEKTKVELTIHEGRHKIVKRMFKALGYYVGELQRVRIGPVTLAGLKRGEWRELTKKEVEMLAYEKKESEKHGA